MTTPLRRAKKNTRTGKREYKPIRVPPSWIKPNARCLYNFIMSYAGDGKPATITGEPYQLAGGNWLVMIERDEDKRRIPAALEALDPLAE